MARKSRMELKQKDRRSLEKLMSGGRASVRVIKRARVLQLLAEGRPGQAVADAVGVSRSTVIDIKARYVQEGLERVLQDAPRGKRPRVFNESQEQQLVAVLCGPSPSGRARWTIRTAAEAAVKRGIVPKVGRETVRVVINNHDLKPWREKNVVRSESDA